MLRRVLTITTPSRRGLREHRPQGSKAGPLKTTCSLSRVERNPTLRSRLAALPKRKSQRLEKGQTETNESLGRLERRQTDTQIRLATEIVAVVQAVNSVKELIGERLDVRDKVADHERRILELERHTDV